MNEKELIKEKLREGKKKKKEEHKSFSNFFLIAIIQGVASLVIPSDSKWIAIALFCYLFFLRYCPWFWSHCLRWPYLYGERIRRRPYFLPCWSWRFPCCWSCWGLISLNGFHCIRCMVGWGCNKILIIFLSHRQKSAV